MERSDSIFDLLDEAKKNDASDETIYRNIHSFLEQKARESGTPRHGHFELTPLCNLDCKMCYVHLSNDQMGKQELLPADTWIDIMQQAIDAGMTRATLSGGECLIYPQFDELYIFLRSKGISVSVLTNGVLLDKNRVEFFKKHPPGSIQVSLYGNSDNAYEQVTGKRFFSVVLSNIQAAKAAKLPIKIAITPSRYMDNFAKETIRLAKDLGVPYMINLGMLTPRQETGRKKPDNDLSLDKYIDLFLFNRELNGRKPMQQKTLPRESGTDKQTIDTGLRCGAGRSCFSIRWNGLMYPCTQLNSISAEPLKCGFLNAWKAVNDAANHFPRFQKCDNCPYSDACTFCVAENENLGSRYQLNPIWCERTWKMVESGLRHVAQQCDQE